MNKVTQQAPSRYNKTPRITHPRSLFNMSRGRTMTFDGDALTPVFRMDVMPGDTITIRMKAFVRLLTLIRPIMDGLRITAHFWNIPDRLVWSNFVKMMGEQINPTDTIDYTVPLLEPFTATPGDIFDHMGIPPETTADLDDIIALYWRAYNLVWNVNYRDQNLQVSAAVNTGDGPDDPTIYQLKPRGKVADYFTSSLPFAQKGPAVTLPIGETAPVIPNPENPYPYFTGDDSEVSGYLYSTTPGTPTTLNMVADPAGVFDTAEIFRWNESTGLIADLSTATGLNINDVRQAAAVQQLLETYARGGTFYADINYQEFGVDTPDARLQRPEFLGGATFNINVTPIAQTSETSAESPQGNLAAMATGRDEALVCHKSMVEHGCIIGMISVRADLTYQQGIHRDFKKQTRLDYPHPTLAHIGEQVVTQSEILATGIAVVDDLPFGFQEQYAHYREGFSELTGLMRTYVTGAIGNVWTLAQELASPVELGNDFIRDNPPLDRVIATPEEPQFQGNFWFDVKAARPLPVYGVPGLTRF